MTIGNSYSFDGIKNLVLKLPTDEIERIYKINNKTVEYSEPERQPTTFRDVIDAVLSIGLIVLSVICVGSIAYYSVGYFNPTIAVVATVFAVFSFGFSMTQTIVETVIGLIFITIPAYLFFTAFSYFESVSISSAQFLVGATIGLVLGWCVAGLSKIILSCFE